MLAEGPSDPNDMYTPYKSPAWTSYWVSSVGSSMILVQLLYFSWTEYNIVLYLTVL